MAAHPPDDQSSERGSSTEPEARQTIFVRPEITRAPVTATVIGLVGGGFSALFGVGGGMVMVPAMVRLLRIRPQRAHGTSLAVVLPTALVGVYRYQQAGHVAWNLVLPLAVGGVLGALLGAGIAAAAGTMKRFFGAFVVLIGFAMVVVPQHLGRSPAPAGALVVTGVGLLVGILGGMFGVGGGLLLVPALVFLLGQDQHVAQGISLAVIVPVSISGALIHARNGNVIPNLAFWLSAGAAMGAAAVGAAVQSLNTETLRTLFGVLLIAHGVWMAARRRRQ